MAYENIRLTENHYSFEKSGGLYYVMDHVLNALLLKTDDGNTAFIYPTDIDLPRAIVEIQFDGKYFWTMEDRTGTPSDGVILRRWIIDSFLCKVQQTITLQSTGSETFQSDTFSVEHYHRKIAQPITGGVDQTIYLDSVDFISAAESQEVYIGPNSSGQYEAPKTVTGVDGGAKTITFASAVTNSFAVGDMLHFARRVWLFNDYYLLSAEGALLELRASSGNVISRKSGTEYDNINSSTFCAYNYYNGSTVKPLLLYMKEAQLHFVDVSDSHKPTVLSSIQDVYKDNGIDRWGVYSICIDDIISDAETDVDLKKARDTIYRLQNGATYSGDDEDWGSYKNYMITTLKPYVNAISLSATPAVIPADSGVSKSDIRAVVYDQYLEPVNGITVEFSDNDPHPGAISPQYVVTSGTGIADAIFSSGSDDNVVTITAAVDQIII